MNKKRTYKKRTYKKRTDPLTFYLGRSRVQLRLYSCSSVPLPVTLHVYLKKNHAAVKIMCLTTKMTYIC